MFVAGQQLTSLSPPKKPDVSVGFFAVKREIPSNQNMIARGCAAELSVARSTMRVNSPVLAVRRMLSFSAIKALIAISLQYKRNRRFTKVAF